MKDNQYSLMRDIKGGTGMAIDYTALGTRIGNHRVKANMSQEDLGAFSNVSNKHISNIELGKAKPSLLRIFCKEGLSVIE